MNNLWSLIGAKYIPSLVYKVRMLTFSQDMIREDVPSIVKRNVPGGVAKRLVEEGVAGALSGLMGNTRKKSETDEGEEGLNSPSDHSIDNEA
jgi:hypothetical protein